MKLSLTNLIILACSPSLEASKSVIWSLPDFLLPLKSNTILHLVIVILELKSEKKDNEWHCLVLDCRNAKKNDTKKVFSSWVRIEEGYIGWPFKLSQPSSSFFHASWSPQTFSAPHQILRPLLCCTRPIPIKHKPQFHHPELGLKVTSAKSFSVFGWVLRKARSRT